MTGASTRERTREETDRKITQTMLEIAASRGVGAITIEEGTGQDGHGGSFTLSGKVGVSDPVNGTTNPKAIPGATMRYCLLVTNGGSATATAIYVADPLPATTSFVPGSLRSGTSCAGATTVEDDNATGADESDPFGAAIAGTTVSASTATLGPGSAFATVFDVTVN